MKERDHEHRPTAVPHLALAVATLSALVSASTALAGPAPIEPAPTGRGGGLGPSSDGTSWEIVTTWGAGAAVAAALALVAGYLVVHRNGHPRATTA